MLALLGAYVRGSAVSTTLPRAAPVRDLTDPAEFPSVHAMIDSGELDDLVDPFEFGLARMLDGIERLVRQRKR